MSKLKLINLSNTCRVCLQQGIKSLSPIFGDSDNIADVICYLADVQIAPRDGLPAAICLNCKIKIEEFYKFRNLIEVSDKTLRSFLKVEDDDDDDEVEFEDVKESIITDNNDPPITYLVSMPNESTQIWDTTDTLELKKSVDDEVELSDQDIKEDLYDENEDYKDNNTAISDVQKQKKNIDIFCQLCSRKFNSVKDLKEHVVNHCLPSEMHDKPAQNTAQKRLAIIPEIKKESICDDFDAVSNEPESTPSFYSVLTANLDSASKTVKSSSDLKNNQTQAPKNSMTLKKVKRKSNESNTTEDRQFPKVRNKLDRIIDQGGICLGFKFKDNYFESVVLCKFCNQELTTDMVNDHASKCLIQNRNLICDECGQQFDETAELKKHKITHSSQPLTCIHCNIHFSNINTYNTHMKRHTLGSRFNCETCGKKFYSNSELIRHVQKHLNNKQYTCNSCDASFVTRPELTRHLKYHTGFKKFKCHLCGKAYYESGHLKVHMRFHSGEKPYICQTCGKAFITKSKLIRHEKIHLSKT